MKLVLDIDKNIRYISIVIMKQTTINNTDMIDYKELLSTVHNEFPEQDELRLNKVVDDLNPDLERLNIQDFVNEVQDELFEQACEYFAEM